MKRAIFTISQGQRLGRLVQAFEAEGRNNVGDVPSRPHQQQAIASGSTVSVMTSITQANGTASITKQVLTVNAAGSISTSTIDLTPLTTKGDLYGVIDIGAGAHPARFPGPSETAILLGNSTSGIYGVTWSRFDVGLGTLTTGATVQISSTAIGIAGNTTSIQLTPGINGFAAPAGVLYVKSTGSGTAIIASTNAGDVGLSFYWTVLTRPAAW